MIIYRLTTKDVGNRFIEYTKLLGQIISFFFNPIRAGGANQPALFSDGYFSMKKRGLEVQNFVTFPNSL